MANESSPFDGSLMTGRACALSIVDSLCQTYHAVAEVQYISGRWGRRLRAARSQSVWYRRLYYALRLFVVAGASIVPVLISISSQSTGSARALLTGLAVGFSIIVAFSAAVLGVLDRQSR